MKKLLSVVIAGLFLTGCNVSDIPNFESMSQLELAEYNSQRSISQMIVCSEDNRSFSRVRRRRCMTVEQMYGSVQNADRLGVLNSVQGYSAEL